MLYQLGRRNILPGHRNVEPERRNILPGRRNILPGRRNIEQGRRNVLPAGTSEYFARTPEYCTRMSEYCTRTSEYCARSSEYCARTSEYCARTSEIQVALFHRSAGYNPGFSKEICDITNLKSIDINTCKLVLNGTVSAYLFYYVAVIVSIILFAIISLLISVFMYFYTHNIEKNINIYRLFRERTDTSFHFIIIFFSFSVKSIFLQFTVCFPSIFYFFWR